MESLHNFQGSTPRHPQPNHAYSSTFGSRDGDFGEKKVSGIPPMHIPCSKGSLPSTLGDTAASQNSCTPPAPMSRKEGSSAMVMRLGNIKRPSKASIDLLGSGQFRKKMTHKTPGPATHVHTDVVTLSSTLILSGPPSKPILAAV